MRLINRMADRVLAAVVPEISAGACCSKNGTKKVEECSCPPNGRLSEKTCTYNCSCALVCGPCRLTGIPCP